jgi:hypothetical protein
MRDAYRVFVRRPEGKIPLEDQRRWENNINMDIQGMGWGRMELIDLAQVGTGGGHW